MVSKIFANKKGGKSYNRYKYVFKFRWFQVESTLGDDLFKDILSSVGASTYKYIKILKSGQIFVDLKLG